MSSSQKFCKVFRIIRPNSQNTVSQLQDHTISTPQIPNPSATQAPVNSPTIQNGRASDFCAADVIVSDCPSKQQYRHEADRQPVCLVFYSEVMKCGGKNQHEQANRREQTRDCRLGVRYQSKHEGNNGEHIEYQTEWCMLNMPVRRFVVHSGLHIFTDSLLLCGAVVSLTLTVLSSLCLSGPPR